LTPLCALTSRPCLLSSDRSSNAILKWIVDQSINSALIDPGKPWQNAKAESFNGKYRDECLNVDYFRSRAEAKVVIETWRRHYNEVRPHSGLKYLTPNEYVAKGARPEDRAKQRAGSLRDVSTPRPGPLQPPPSKTDEVKMEPTG
jgi:putative transposase